jgi:hypothetical protein
LKDVEGIERGEKAKEKRKTYDAGRSSKKYTGPNCHEGTGDRELRNTGAGGREEEEGGAERGSPLIVVPNRTVTFVVVVLGYMSVPCALAAPLTYNLTPHFW